MDEISPADLEMSRILNSPWGKKQYPNAYGPLVDLARGYSPDTWKKRRDRDDASEAILWALKREMESSGQTMVDTLKELVQSGNDELLHQLYQAAVYKAEEKQQVKTTCSFCPPCPTIPPSQLCPMHAVWQS